LAAAAGPSVVTSSALADDLPIFQASAQLALEEAIEPPLPAAETADELPADILISEPTKGQAP
jgi:hypothetical protein